MSLQLYRPQRRTWTPTAIRLRRCTSTHRSLLGGSRSGTRVRNGGDKPPGATFVWPRFLFAVGWNSPHPPPWYLAAGLDWRFLRGGEVPRTRPPPTAAQRPARQINPTRDCPSPRDWAGCPRRWSLCRRNTGRPRRSRPVRTRFAVPFPELANTPIASGRCRLAPGTAAPDRYQTKAAGRRGTRRRTWNCGKR